MLTPLQAVAELEKRRRVPGLKEEVEEYLGGDIPAYFADGPVLYLGRHIATPNFETLRFIHLVEPLGFKAVISQDTKDQFVSQNHAKKALCKLPVCRRISQKEGRAHEIIQYQTIVDFNAADGKQFREIDTVWGEPLVHFHKRMMDALSPVRVETPDDAEWIDRNHRGHLLEHFKRLLALFIIHGIFFEDYVPEDKDFVRTVFRPAMEYVEKRFGYRPLVSQLVPASIESELFWISYPEKAAIFIKESKVHKKAGA